MKTRSLWSKGSNITKKKEQNRCLSCLDAISQVKNHTDPTEGKGEKKKKNLGAWLQNLNKIKKLGDYVKYSFMF